MTDVEGTPMSLPKFELPSVEFVNDFCGPSEHNMSFCLGSMELYPFDLSNKLERLGRVCDFTYATSQRVTREGKGPEESTEFQLVDTRPVKINRFQKGYQRRAQQYRRQNLQQQPQMHLQQTRGGVPSAQSQRQYQLQQAQRQQQWQRNNRQRQLAEWSIEPQHGWTLVSTEELSALPRLSLDTSKIVFEDIEWRGELRVYDKTLDRVTPKNPIMLSDTYTQTKSFYWPGTADDGILVHAFDENKKVSVAATDQILACLMSAAQSRLSWHLVFHKSEGKLFIDKHNGTSIDLITVDETSKEPPLSDNPSKYNRPAELGAEALKINQNFSQQALSFKMNSVDKFTQPPFVESDDVPASRLYRYRIVTLPGKPYDTNSFNSQPVSIVVRSEIDSVLPETTNSYVSIKALSEAIIARGSKPWRHQLLSQQGALIAQETKNNHCKVGKWVSQCLISGCDILKIGFVTRCSPENNQRHMILTTLTYKVKELGVQIGLQEDNVWGIVRYMIDLLMAQRDGHYILIKDPVKPEMKLYRVSTEVIGDAEVNDTASKVVDTSQSNAT